MNELAHHGADNELRRLAGAGQAVFKALAPSGLIERDHSRHIQRLAQESMADLGWAEARSPSIANDGLPSSTHPILPFDP